MVSLGQSNTIINCPALTTHSELSLDALGQAGITPTTIRFAVGDEDPEDLLEHLTAAAVLAIDPAIPGFSKQFPDITRSKAIIRRRYVETHTRYIESKLAAEPAPRGV